MTATSPHPRTPLTHTPLYARLYVQVLVAIALGALLGALKPDLAASMKPLGPQM